MISPLCSQIKYGLLLRGESDLRIYSGLFRKVHNEINGIHQILTTRAIQQFAEADQWGIFDQSNFLKSAIITFARGGDLEQFDGGNPKKDFAFNALKDLPC